MDFTIILTVILINTLITLLVFNINAEQQSKIIQAQNEFNNSTVGLFKDICKEQIELYSKVYDLEFKNYIKEAEEKIMKDFEIIENTDKARDEFEEHLYGSDRYFLTREHIKALLAGKCLATEINNEYAIFIELDKEREEKTNENN